RADLAERVAVASVGGRDRSLVEGEELVERWPDGEPLRTRDLGDRFWVAEVVAQEKLVAEPLSANRVSERVVEARGDERLVAALGEWPRGRELRQETVERKRNRGRAHAGGGGVAWPRTFLCM